MLQLTYSKLESLHHRTGIDLLLMGVRTDPQDVVCPQIWASSERVEEFVHLATKWTTSEFAFQMENYSLSGIQGV